MAQCVLELGYSRQPPQSGHGLLTLKLGAAVRRFSGLHRSRTINGTAIITND
jgi:hypothetical protein